MMGGDAPRFRTRTSAWYVEYMSGAVGGSRSRFIAQSDICFEECSRDELCRPSSGTDVKRYR